MENDKDTNDRKEMHDLKLAHLGVFAVLELLAAPQLCLDNAGWCLDNTAVSLVRGLYAIDGRCSRRYRDSLGDGRSWIA